MKLVVTVACMLILLGPVSPAVSDPEPQKELKSVSLLPQWIPQAQFAGYMVALEKGFYRDVGLDLTLRTGGPGSPPFELLASGKATFCTAWLSNAIEARASGFKIVCLAQIIQRSALMLVARKSSKIEVPRDLDGKKVALWAGHFSLQPMMFFHKHGITVNVVPNYSSVALFLKGGLDAMAAMWYNEYHSIINSGINPDEMNVFFLNEFGPNFPEDGLYTLESTYDADPQMCGNFAAASLRGWQWVFNHQEQALDIVMKHAESAHTGTNRPHQRWMLNRMKDLILSAEQPGTLGKLRPEDYASVGHVLKEYSFIDKIPDFADLYRGIR